jgi:hypothetical protein
MEIETRIHGVAGNNETDSACRSIPRIVYALLAISTRECGWIIQ